MRSDTEDDIMCPDDHTLAAFLERRLSEVELERCEEHLATCATCLDIVATLLPTTRSGAASTRTTVPGARQSALPVARPPRWRRWALAASVVLVGGGLLLGAMRVPLGGRLGAGMTRLATRWLGKGFQVASIDVHLTSPTTVVVTLREVRLAPMGRIVASADEIGVSVGLATLLSGDSAISRLRVVGANVELSGSVAVPVVWPQSDRRRVLALLGRARRVDVSDSRVVLLGDGAAPLAIEELGGGLERNRDGAEMALQGRVGAGRVDVVGHLEGSPPHLVLTVGGRDLDASALPMLGGRVTGAADLRLDVTNAGRDLRFAGRIAVANGTLLGWGAPRLLALDETVRTSLAAAAPALAGDDLAFDDARAVFTWRHGTWRLPRIFVATDGVMAGGGARVAGDGRITGRGLLRIPAALTTELARHDPGLGAHRTESGSATLPFVVAGAVSAPRFTLDRP